MSLGCAVPDVGSGHAQPDLPQTLPAPAPCEIDTEQPAFGKTDHFPCRKMLSASPPPDMNRDLDRPGQTSSRKGRDSGMTPAEAAGLLEALGTLRRGSRKPA